MLQPHRGHTTTLLYELAEDDEVFTESTFAQRYLSKTS